MTNNLRKARKEKGFTQKQISNILDVTQSNISNFEKGKSFLSSEQIIKLVKVLDCSADYLLGLIDDEQKQPHKKRVKP